MKSSFFVAAASVALAPAVEAAANIINSGQGYGTYYYDVKDPKGCSNDFSSMNTGNVECSQGPLSLNKINSNNLVAMNNTLLASDPAKYCGKRVIVTVNGKESPTPFYIGDGCARCGTGSSTQQGWKSGGAPGLDFSLTELQNLDPNACNDGVVKISWQITDESIFDFNTNSGSSSGGAADPAPSEDASPSTLATSISTAAGSHSTKTASPSSSATGNHHSHHAVDVEMPDPESSSTLATSSSTDDASPSATADSSSSDDVDPPSDDASPSATADSSSTDDVDPPLDDASPSATADSSSSDDANPPFDDASPSATAESPSTLVTSFSPAAATLPPDDASPSSATKNRHAHHAAETDLPAPATSETDGGVPNCRRGLRVAPWRSP